MDALFPFGAALSATTFEAAAKAHNMDDEGMARVKAKPGRATYVRYYDCFGLSCDD